jgi:hypothetical protein
MPGRNAHSSSADNAGTSLNADETVVWDEQRVRRTRLLRRLLRQGEAGVCARSIGALGGRPQESC